MARLADAAAPAPATPPRLQRAWLTRGPLALCLWPIAALYAALVAVRRGLYRIGWLRTQRLPVPVIVVGNLIAGGAGKTPTVMAVVTLLRRSGYTPGVISRGYGGAGDGVVDVTPHTPATVCGDEPLLLRLRLGVPVRVGRDRVAAGMQLLQHHPEVDIIVSDDGLQHLRLARDAQVLVFDERGIGNGWLLPAGPLREPMPRQLPARSLVLYNAPRASTPWPGTTAQRSLAGAVPLAPWWAGEPPSRETLAALTQRRVLAVAGMAQPQRYFDMLAAAGLNVDPLPLPDHHPYTTLPWPADAADVVVTEKDAVKLDPARMGTTRVWVAPLDFHTDAAFDAALLALLPPRGPHRTDHGHPIA